jgi:hypothetical protein
MAFLVQDDNGTIEGANSYVTPGQVRGYWSDRGVDLSSKTDPEMQAACIDATDYLDSRYAFAGYQIYRLQGTQWPRGGVTSFLRGLPPALISAACQLAQRSVSGVKLSPDPTYDKSGQRVTEQTKKVGPIEVSLKFAETSGDNPTTALPQFPEVTLMLTQAGLIGSAGGVLVRG